MEEVEIIRLNVERYRRLLQTNLDEQTRRATQAMLAEFERKLVRPELTSRPTSLGPNDLREGSRDAESAR
jgi:hypothetical protein